MKNSKIRSMLVTLITILIIIPMLTVTAYARTDDDYYEDEDDLIDILIPIPVVVTAETRTESEPLTPSGNLSLVDDAFVESIGEKQFITVETKNGNYFYIVIDRAGHTDNVHFLNLVDEFDLLALLDDDVELPEPKQPEPYVSESLQTKDDEPAPSEPDNDSSGSMIALVVFLLLAGGGAGFYFKVIKPKQAANNSGSLTSLDELDGDDGENEFNGSGDDEYSDNEFENESEPDDENSDADDSSDIEYDDEDEYA